MKNVYLVCFSLLPFFHHTCLPPACIQRKSNRAKEKKARRQEERAAMDAVCAKVDAANKVTCRAVIHTCVALSCVDWIDCPQVESKLVFKCAEFKSVHLVAMYRRSLRFCGTLNTSFVNSGFWLIWYSVKAVIASDSPLASGDIWDRKLVHPVSWLWA